jgi:hypothetical protein
MIEFKQSSEQTGIEPWPSLKESGATILDGDPQQSGRLTVTDSDGRAVTYEPGDSA